MSLFKKKIVKKTYDREHMKPVIRASICTGEEVAGFKDIRTGKIEEIMLIRSPEDLEKFKAIYEITEKIAKEYWIRRGVVMRTIGNILWFIFGGLLGGLAWIFAGCIWCITIIGIPVGLQCFKFATLAFWPFGKEIVYGNGMFSFLVNLIWIIFFGWEMALGNLIVGCIWCITIVGIPFGKQFFKMARLSFMPFGASVIG